MERPPLRYLKPTPGKTFRTLNEAEIEATVKNNLTLAAALLANQPVDPEVWKPAAAKVRLFLTVASISASFSVRKVLPGVGLR